MPYVHREGGEVVGLFGAAQPGYAEEFLADNHADVLAYLNPPVEPTFPVPQLVGAELLTVSGGEVTGYDNIIGFSFAADVGDFYLFYAMEFADLSYSYSVEANGYSAHVTERDAGYMRVQVQDGNGDLADPVELSIQLYCRT